MLWGRSQLDWICVLSSGRGGEGGGQGARGEVVKEVGQEVKEVEKKVGKDVGKETLWSQLSRALRPRRRRRLVDGAQVV